MKSDLRILFIAAFAAVSAVAQQDTNLPPAEAQSPDIQVESLSEEDRIQFLLDVAQAYIGETDGESAITTYERILEIDPVNNEARYLLSTLYITTKQYAKAEQMLTGLIEEYPDNFQLKNNLAWQYATAEDPAFRDGQKAIELAQEAMILAPTDHHVWSTLAEAYYSTGQYEKAYRAINQMLALGQRYGSDITPEMAEGYNKQISKCRRALATEKAFEEDETDPPSTTPSVDKDAQEQ
ncbi:MAG TPA: tetratricopeptide repeat protein [Pontiella sp.]|nr:tetratricopeptide repeat protein [Pontiella sp.]